MTNRKADHHAEEELGKFLDKYLYPQLKLFLEKNNSKNKYFFKREKLKEEQFKGKDITLKIIDSKENENFRYFDEKAQLYHMPGIPTFAFEIDSIQDNILREGWFFDKEKYTNYYVLLWPKLINNVLFEEYKNGNREKKAAVLLKTTEDDYDNVEFFIIDRIKLINFFKDNHIKEEIMQKKQAIRTGTLKPEKLKNGIQYYYFKDKNGNKINDYYLTYSFTITEKPINLVIKKGMLKAYNWGKYGWKYTKVSRKGLL